MSCSSQIAYDLAWTQQIDKEFCAAEINRKRGGDTDKPKLAPHPISGFIPIDDKF